MHASQYVHRNCFIYFALCATGRQNHLRFLRWAISEKARGAVVGSRSSRRSRSRSRSSRRRSSSSSSGSCRRSNRGGGGGGNGSGSGSEACLTCCGFLSICRRTRLASSRFPIATPPPEALACNICSTLHRLSFLVRNVSFFSGTQFPLFSAGFLNPGFRLSLYVCQRCSKAFSCLFLRC